jgi:hypothetical protein
MSSVLEIESAVSKLPPNELSAFRNWFMEFDADAWDQQFAMDVADGRLDKLADEAINDARNGRVTDL